MPVLPPKIEVQLRGTFIDRMHMSLGTLYVLNCDRQDGITLMMFL